MGILDCSEQSKNIKFEICHEINDYNCLSERTKNENYSNKNKNIICYEIINENFISNNENLGINKDKNRYLNLIQTPTQNDNSISYLNTLIKNESQELDFFNLSDEKSIIKNNKNNNKKLIINKKIVNDNSKCKSLDKKYFKKRKISSIQKNESNFNFYDSSMYIIYFIIYVLF